MRVLVTGASGFVGAATASTLEERGHEVIRAVGSRSAGQDGTFPIDIADTSTFDALESIESIDACVHCAGLAHRRGTVSPGEYSRVNAEGAGNAARLARRLGAERFIHLSSVSVYGKPGSPRPITESETPRPQDEYSKSKLEGENIVKEICRGSGTKLVVLRPVSVIGEGDPGNVARLIRAVQKGRFVQLGDGSNLKSLIYVGDLARAIASALQIEDDLSVFNVTGEDITVKDLSGIIARETGREITSLPIPATALRRGLRIAKIGRRVGIVERYRKALDTWLSDTVFSGESFREKQGFIPHTSISDAIKREVEYMRAK